MLMNFKLPLRTNAIRFSTVMLSRPAACAAVSKPACGALRLVRHPVNAGSLPVMFQIAIVSGSITAVALDYAG